MSADTPTRRKAASDSVALVAGTALAAAGITGLAITAMTPAPSTPACATEDSTGCYWDATTQGNGQGESFYTDADGNVYYAETSDDSACFDRVATLFAQQEDMLLTAWENGVAYSDDLRTNNLDVLTYQLGECK